MLRTIAYTICDPLMKAWRPTFGPVTHRLRTSALKRRVLAAASSFSFFPCLPLPPRDLILNHISAEGRGGEKGGGLKKPEIVWDTADDRK